MPVKSASVFSRTKGCPFMILDYISYRNDFRGCSHSIFQRYASLFLLVFETYKSITISIPVSMPTCVIPNEKLAFRYPAGV